MRVTLDIKSEGGQHSLVVSGPDGPWPDRPVTWLTGRLLVARDAASTVTGPEELARAVECCDTGGDRQKQKEQLGQLERYGALLFEAAFGDGVWQDILAAVAAAGADYLEVAVWGETDDDHVALQALRWEALHDGKRFVAAQGATLHAEGRDVPIPVGVVRLIRQAAATARDAASGNAPFREIEHIPRVLFAVGSHLTDQRVRPGAEFMGIMRRLDRNGGSVRARVLDRATRSGLVTELEEFQPDVLHLIGHGQRSGKQVKIQLRGEPRGEEWVSAEELLNIFGDARHSPTMVVLSACQTGSADDGLSALPFAARLVAGSSVAGGVPVVVAMAGDISDMTCRVFTRAMTTAIGQRVPLWKAVIRGRRAAFHGGLGPDSGHWVMPALFLADHMPDKTCLVNTARAEKARTRIEKLGMAWDPVFCGRATFITKFDRLLDGRDPLNALVAYTPDARSRFGGKRLLRELGARAVRSDVLPVLLGPFAKDAPQNLIDLVTELKNRLDEMRAQVPGFKQRAVPSRAVAAATEGAGRFEIAQAIRWDLDALVADLAEDDPVRRRDPGQPRTVLLCHRVDTWGVLDDLIHLLDTPGLKGAQTPVPVVLTGADIRQLNHARTHIWAGPPSWINCDPLDRFSVDDEEDILAYKWWLLNPPEDEPVYALSPTANDLWSGLLRLHLKTADAQVYPADYLYEWARKTGDLFFNTGDDDKLLASYARVMR